MFVLKSFCCLIDLHTACKLIGVAGTVYTIVCGSMLYRRAVALDFILALAAIILTVLFLVSKLMMLLGTIKKFHKFSLYSCRCGIVSIIACLCTVGYWHVLIGTTLVRVLFVALFLMTELYYVWITYSYWRTFNEDPTSE